MDGYAFGRFRVRPAETEQEVLATKELRHKAFRGGVAGVDTDTHDDHCLHVMIEDLQTEKLAGCFRLLELPNGRGIDRYSYSAQYYDLSALEAFDAPISEMGRLCTAEPRPDPEILRSAWSALAAYVDKRRLGMLFGCSSFKGHDPSAFANSFAFLADRHLAPEPWQPKPRHGDHFAFHQLDPKQHDIKQGMQALPPLLRSYLTLGGWVSDHAVIDRDLGTTHVFTALEIAAIPESRKRMLRASAARGVRV